MAHFAELGLDSIVTRVVVIHNNELLDENGQESEAKGAAFCRQLFGGNWMQTSYNGTIRKNFAGIGYVYDAQRNAFISPKPYASWILNESTCQWNAPISMPIDEKRYVWDEATINWLEISITG
jgi:hypothetical protein